MNRETTMGEPQPEARGKKMLAQALKHPGHAFKQVMNLIVSRWKARRCSSVGPWLRVDGKLIIVNDGAIHMGERVRIRGTHVPVELASYPTGKLTIGASTFINSGVSICTQASITIGSNCAIGNYTLIMDTDFHNVEDHNQAPEAKPIVIEDDVWIAAQVTVLKGVRIGRGAVVAAGAVVNKDVPPFTVVAGVPAKVIKQIACP